MEEQKVTKVLIVEDHSTVRIGIKYMLGDIVDTPDTVMADNMNSALQALSEDSFDLVILDLNIPGGGAPATIRKIRDKRRNARILVFSANDEQVYALPCLQAGADGYLSKNSTDEEFAVAVKNILGGKKYLSPEMQQQAILKVAGTSGGHARNISDILSARETEVMQLLLKGMGTAEIAAKIHLQLSTISTYKMKIFEKMGVRNIVELVEKMKLYEE
ncbi:response regulator [Chitinophagaceae bacterium MMS25-I14]